MCVESLPSFTEGALCNAAEVVAACLRLAPHHCGGAWMRLSLAALLCFSTLSQCTSRLMYL